MNTETLSTQMEQPPPGLLLQFLEVRAFWESYATLLMHSIWPMSARGDGHPVLVLPGLLAGDASTALMRSFLKSRGFASIGWGQGLNLGLREGVLEHAHDTLRELYLEHGRKVSIIGWSLGGLYARELAKQSPEMVRLVISLGSSFTGHTREINAHRLYEFAIDSDHFHGTRSAAPPVPTTAIWSPSDGFVAWQCSVETRREMAENIVVELSHLGLGAHPAVLFAITDRLEQAEGHWEPFHRKGWRRLVYGDPHKEPVRPES